MRVLVTGGSGWIGRATVKALERRGHDAVVFDHKTGHDIRSNVDVDDAVRNVGHVIHLAGVLGTHELFESPYEAVQTNVAGSLEVTLACVKYDVGLTEITMPRVNPSLYAATKACAMDIALAYQAAGRLRCSFVRAFNAYGPGQAYGGDHPQKIIPTFASKAWAGEPLPVWGDGLLRCDLVHVDDVARMLVEAMRFDDGQVFDAGTGHAQTVLEVAVKVLDIVGKPDAEKGIEFKEPRVGERSGYVEGEVATGDGWKLLDGWRPVFDRERFVEAVESYR